MEVNFSGPPFSLFFDRTIFIILLISLKKSKSLYAFCHSKQEQVHMNYTSIHETFMEHLLCASHNSRLWAYKDDLDKIHTLMELRIWRGQ